MPLYEYECPKCGKRYEIFSKFSNMNDARYCKDENCNAVLERKVSSPLFNMKGACWEKDGYYKP